MNFKGKFIVFEGGEGGGKTTQVKRLAEKLQKDGKEVIITHEPGGTELGKEIRSMLLHRKEKIHGRTEVLLFCADRAHHIETVIRPALKAGEIVICDRFSGSTFAYQCYGRGLGNLEKIKMVDEYARDGINPDLVIFLDVPPEIGLKRVSKDVDSGVRKDFTKFEEEKIKFHQTVRNGFLELSKQDDWNWQKIDGTLSKEEIERKVWEVVKEIL